MELQRRLLQDGLLTFKYAHSNVSEDILRMMEIKAHSARAAATTHALLRGVEVQHILEAAYWASPSTFIETYFPTSVHHLANM